MKPKPSPERSALAKWVRLVRGGLTQDEAAARVGIDRSTWADWERDAGTPRYANLMKIKEAFAIETLPEGIGPAVAVGSMSDPGSKMPPGLGAFLDRHGKRLNQNERAFLENIRFRRDPDPSAKMDDAFWWRIVESLGLGDDL